MLYEEKSDCIRLEDNLNISDLRFDAFILLTAFTYLFFFYTT